jgi:hypothetical protein
MAKDNQTSRTSETEISVDMNADNPDKAVTRRAADGNIGRQVRDDQDQDDRPRTKSEKELFKRMGRLERNLTRQFDQRRADDEARHQRELSEVKEQLAKVQVERGGADDAADRAYETQMAALKDKLAAAYEKGDSAGSADITLQISKLDAQYWAKKAQVAGVVTRETTDPAKPVAQPNPNADRTNKGPTREGSRFIAANEDWWDDPEFAIEQGASNAIYVELVNKEGFDPKDAETFKEVAKRLKAKFPNLDVRAGDGKGPGDDEDDDDEASRNRGGGEQRTRRAAAANIQDRGSENLDRQNRRDPNRRVLTNQEKETMRACRLDPDNDRDVVQFMREAAALEAAQS